MHYKLVIARNSNQYMDYLSQISPFDRLKCVYLSSEESLRGLRGIEIIRTGEWWLSPYCESPILAEIEGRNNGNVFHEGEHVNVRGKSVGKTFKEYILHHKPLENVVISHFEKEDVDEYITIRGDYFLPIDLERINTFSGEIKKMFDEIIYSL